MLWIKILKSKIDENTVEIIFVKIIKKISNAPKVRKPSCEHMDGKKTADSNININISISN
jgi:hypothetical protein